VTNRALSGPLNIHCDHSDSMGARDSGWIQLYGEDVQEAYDNAFQAMRIAEHPDVMLPVMHCQDGFIISHGVERMELLPDSVVKDFIGIYTPRYSLLDTKNPTTFGPVDLQDHYFEHKRQQVDGMEKALAVIEKIGKEFGDLTGRYYGHLTPYRLDDAEVAIVVMGSTAGTTKVAVDMLRDKGIKAGLLKLRTFRPFPAEAVAKALAGTQVVAVLDRDIAFGAQGNPIFEDVCTALYESEARPTLVNYVYGLGGRDTNASQIMSVYTDLLKIAETGTRGPMVRYLGLRD
ncbi:MAG: transketolase C-terminal domain-containing protein, partial [Dehalococcoidia bacterium]|nr:transketolase C-terminal domain-containing protein [Dehalococcoidia bacterium]